MKKILLLASLTAGTEAVHAQSIAAGTTMLTGSIGYSANTEKTTNSGTNSTATTTVTYSTFSLSVLGGYFVADNLAVGVSLNHVANGGSASYSGPGTFLPSDPASSASWRVGPFVQYYHMLTEQFGLAGTLGAGYENDRGLTFNGISGRSIDQTAKGFYAALTPSVVFFPIPKLSFNASIGQLGYSRLNKKTTGQPDSYEDIASTFGAGFGLSQLQFGGTYYFGR